MNDLRGDFSWSRSWFSSHTLRGIGIILHLLVRELFGIFFLAAGIHKIQTGWVSTDIMKQIFLQRLTELHPSSFAAGFLQDFSIPYYVPLSYIITYGEIAIGVGLILGIAVRLSGWGAVAMMIGFGMGGYYDASLLPLLGMALLCTTKPSGHWLGFDRKLYPLQPWFFR